MRAQATEGQKDRRSKDNKASLRPRGGEGGTLTGGGPWWLHTSAGPSQLPPAAWVGGWTAWAGARRRAARPHRCGRSWWSWRAHGWCPRWLLSCCADQCPCSSCPAGSSSRRPCSLGGRATVREVALEVLRRPGIRPPPLCSSPGSRSPCMLAKWASPSTAAIHSSWESTSAPTRT